MGGRLGGRRVGLERPPAREQLPRDDRECVPVARGACPLAPRLLRRQVPGRAEDRAGLRERLHAGRGRDPEVGDLHVPAAVADQVARLDVAMDDAGLVCRVERGGRVVEPAEHLRRRARARWTLLEAAAREVLHDDQRASVVLVDVEDRDDVGVAREAGGRERLALEPLPQPVVLRVALCQHLDRHVATELLVGGAEDLAHAAAPDVLGVAVTGRKGVGRDGHARLGNRWGSAFGGMETFGKSWPWCRGARLPCPACSPTAGVVSPSGSASSVFSSRQAAFPRCSRRARARSGRRP